MDKGENDKEMSKVIELTDNEFKSIFKDLYGWGTTNGYWCVGIPKETIEKMPALRNFADILSDGKAHNIGIIKDVDKNYGNLYIDGELKAVLKTSFK